MTYSDFRPKNMEVHLYPCDYELEYRDVLLHPERTRFYHEPVRHGVQCIDVGVDQSNQPWTPKGKPYHISFRWPCAMSREQIFMSREDFVQLYNSMKEVIEDK